MRFQLVVDCADPDRLSRFWAAALDYVPAGKDDLGRVDLIEDPSGTGPTIWFQAVPEMKSTKNRLHLDLDAGAGPDAPRAVREDAVREEAARLESLGATTLVELTDPDWPQFFAIAMLDPEGNEFDVH